jgi:hypothetical protein
MLTLALVMMSAAVLWGGILALLHMQATRRIPRSAGLAHGVAGVAALLVLLFALRGPPRGVLTGVAPFGPLAAVLAAGAAVLGLGVWWLLRRRSGVVGLVIAVHATVAITAYVLLLAYVGLG